MPESLEWHERLILRLIKNNSDATIADYLKITEPYNYWEYIDHLVYEAAKEIIENFNKK